MEERSASNNEGMTVMASRRWTRDGQAAVDYAALRSRSVCEVAKEDGWDGLDPDDTFMCSMEGSLLGVYRALMSEHPTMTHSEATVHLTALLRRVSDVEGKRERGYVPTLSDCPTDGSVFDPTAIHMT